MVLKGFRTIGEVLYMNRNAAEAISWALAAVAFAIATLLFGRNLMPALSEAQQVGNHVQWYFTWGIIGLTVLSAVVVAGFFIKTGLDEMRRS